MRWTNKHLRADFDRYNRKYFGGKLDCVDVKFVSLTAFGKTTRFRNTGGRRSQKDRFAIKISKVTSSARRVWRMTLLHEMVHVENRCVHSCGPTGKHFNARMAELAVAGAFNGIW